jgi:hypothetical protein
MRKIKVLDVPGVEVEYRARSYEGKPIYEVQRSQVKPLIRGLGRRGRLLSVTFRKKDGSARKMTGRYGCHKKAAELNKTGVNRNTHADFNQYERLMETTPGIRDTKGRVFVVKGAPCYSE